MTSAPSDPQTPPPATADSTSLLFDAACRALAHPGRRAVIRLLAEYGPLSMRQLRASFAGVPRSTLREQLAQLQQCGLVMALPRQRRLPPSRTALPELRALSELAQMGVDGREQHWALCPAGLALLHCWLGKCLHA